MYGPLNKYCLLLLFYMLGISLLMAQDRTCGTMAYMEENLEKDPAFQENRKTIEKFATNPRASASRSNMGIITIPTVVHIVYNDPTENISDAQVLSQIQVLNEDFRRLNADATNTPSDFQAVAADVEIEFCLASLDPNGFATTGITRTMTNELSFGTNDQIKFNASGGKDAWDTNSYLNIWVGDMGILLGYAQLPGGNVATDGIVISYEAFGTTGTASPPFHQGRTTTHEVGHWLNLYHIWGDGACGLDDAVSDTPIASMPSSNGAPCTYPAQNTCDEGTGDLPDMFQNFMDYSHDACMNLFTNGQKIRMRSLFDGNNARSSILNSNGCNSVGSLVTCSDGIQNGDEIGVDCGGSNCVDCSTLCNDGIKNGNEMGIDCGGSCSSCPPEAGEVCSTAVTLTFNGTYTVLQLDGMGATHSPAINASWYRFGAPEDGYIEVSSCGGGIDTRVWIYEGDCTNLTQIAQEDDNCIAFANSAVAEEIIDVPVKKGKDYFIEWDDRWSREGFDFSFTFRAATSCQDGVQNGDETGIDCGGSRCPACPSILSFTSKNELSFSDPCNCLDPKNCSSNNTLLFHDVMRIPSSGRLASGLDIRVYSSANFFINVPCGGTLLEPTSGLNGTSFKEVSTGIYELEYWRPSSYLPKLAVIENNLVTIIPDAVFSPICRMESCNQRVVNIPTLTQWGKIIFLLLVLNLSLIFLYKLEVVNG